MSEENFVNAKKDWESISRKNNLLQQIDCDWNGNYVTIIISKIWEIYVYRAIVRFWLKYLQYSQSYRNYLKTF